MSQQQYFKQYAEPEIYLLEGFPHCQYNKVLCIPVFDEHHSFLDSIQVAAQNYNGKALLILIINQPDDIENCERNDKLVSLLNTYPCLWQNNHGLQLHRLATIDVLFVDRYSTDKRIPRKKGVGLARKIACDLAAYLFHMHRLTEAQIYCSDADVIFPIDYFSANIPKNNSAAIFNFTHSGSISKNSISEDSISEDNASVDNIFADNHSEITQATSLYEKSLHHYVEGLRRAGSAYAYHTIGSCLLISITHYIQARGFPKRPAGEDFYLLNKLQKLAPVFSLEHPTITIQSRLSNRVPFGTGPAIGKLISSNMQQAKIFYHPSCFDILGKFLIYLDTIADTGDVSKNTIANVKDNPKDNAIDNVKDNIKDNKLITAMYLHELANTFNLHNTVSNIFKTHRNVASRKKHLHEWFDGFKTLKAVHYLRDNYFPSVSYAEIQYERQHELKRIETKCDY